MSTRVYSFLRQSLSVSPSSGRRRRREPDSDSDGIAAPLIDPSSSESEGLSTLPKDGAGVEQVSADRETPLCRLVPQRWILAFLLHSGLAVTYAMRVGLSVAAAPSARLHANATATNSTTYHSNATMYSEFGWSSTDEGVVLGAFFQGYILTQTISAVLARRFGGKAVLATSMACSCLLTWATPVVAADLRLLVACRVCLGLVQGAAYPATLTMVGKWYTARERASFLGFIIAGPYLGEALTFPLAPLVMETPALGWPYIFYFLSILGGVWLLLFLGLVSLGARAEGEGRAWGGYGEGVGRAWGG